MVTWFGWSLIAMQVLACLMTIGQIGKPRQPIEHGAAIFSVVIAALITVGILTVGTGSL